MTKKTVTLEIGTEELPAIELHAVTNRLAGDVKKRIGKQFAYDDIRIFTTPRRIIVSIVGVPEVIEASKDVFKGPSEKIAFDSDGNPTKAALGFARGKGISADDLELREVKGVKHVFAVIETPEKQVADMLPGLLTDIITSINWKKVQRWGSTRDEFARPVRWLLAMFGDKVVDIEFAGLRSSNITFGHRFLNPGPYDIDSADGLVDTLRSANVVPSEEEREQIIREQIKQIEAQTGFVATLPKSIMEEVVNLCEYPTCIVGEFDELFLQVPKEIIVDAMLVHQRYFPLFEKADTQEQNSEKPQEDKRLTNKFIVVSNGNPNYSENIIDGNQRVVAARLYDAKFFYDEDKKHPLESYVDKLDEVVFQEQLGTMKAKAYRVSRLSEYIAKLAGLPQEDVDAAKRAGLLAKADLVTGAVVEFTQVQGVMGSYYALASGEPEEIATAIGQHYRPRFAGDLIPDSNVGRCVAAADKIDTICGMFAVDMLPTGSSDPFALRRSAIGILSIMRLGMDFKLIRAIDFSLDMYLNEGVEFNKGVVEREIITFFIVRTRVMLKEMGVSHESVDAIAATAVNEPMTFMHRARALMKAKKDLPETYEDMATAFARANNLREKSLGIEFDKNIMSPVELQLCEAIDEAKTVISKHLEQGDYAGALDQLAKLRGPVDEFFEKTMIMVEDEKIRTNRLKLLNAFINVFVDLADFSKLAKK